jgi:hypothetical protein
MNNDRIFYPLLKKIGSLSAITVLVVLVKNHYELNIAVNAIDV